MASMMRRQYIVKKNFQLRIFLETVIFMFFVAVLVGWTVYLGIFKTLLFELSGEKITLVNRLISFRMLIWFLPTVFSIIIISVFLSHQIAGPLFVFQRRINEMATGQPVRKIQLRKYDRLKDFADDLNKLIDYVNRLQTQENR